MDWQDLVIRIMTAPTDDLRELARIAGKDPKTFYRDANFRKADLSKQDLNGIDLTSADTKSAKLPRIDTVILEAATSGELSDLAPRLRAELNLARGNEFLERGLIEVDETWLHKAATAFREALSDVTRADDAMFWAKANDRLGLALLEIGEKTDDPATLKAAIVALMLALEIWSEFLEGLEVNGVLVRLASPETNSAGAKLIGVVGDWAIHVDDGVSMRLSAVDEANRIPASMMKGKLNAILSAAKDAPSRRPIDQLDAQSLDNHNDQLAQAVKKLGMLQSYWVETTCKLARAQSILGASDGKLALMEEAVLTCSAALAHVSPKNTPLYWARIQVQLGDQLAALGRREAGNLRLEAAVAAYRAALQVFEKETAPKEWATIHLQLGRVLKHLGARSDGSARLKEAVSAYRTALDTMAQTNMRLDQVTASADLGFALAGLAERTLDLGLAMEAHDRLLTAEAELNALDRADLAVQCAAQIPYAQALIARLSGEEAPDSAPQKE